MMCVVPYYKNEIIFGHFTRKLPQAGMGEDKHAQRKTEREMEENTLTQLT